MHSRERSTASELVEGPRLRGLGVPAQAAPALEHVVEILQARVAEHPQKEAFVDADSGARMSFADLHDRIGGAAEALREIGIGQGDRVALIAHNGEEFVAAWFGILAVGASVVPVPVVSAAPELSFRVKHAKCGLVLCDQRAAEVAEAAVVHLPGVHLRRLSALRRRASLETLSLPSSGAAMILYTSGTTGHPKGAAISHASLLAHTANLVAHTLRLGPEDVVLGVLPFTHSYGIRMAVLAPLHAGAKTLSVGRFDALETLELASREGVSWLPGVPTMFHRWSKVEAVKLDRLRWCLSAGAPLAPEIRQRAEAALGAEIRQGYGLTEATFSTIDAPPSPPTEDSVGPPVMGVEISIRDEAGEELPLGAEGEIRIRGQNVMLGYVDDEEATDQVLEGGWLHTGDVGKLDERGRLFVVDRLKDMIIRGGHNVYPSEVEAALVEHPAVDQVAVVGRPSVDKGEEIVAVLVGRPAEVLAELREFADARLAKTKVPREVAFVDVMPLGPSGKVLKRVLREQIASGELSTHAL